MRLRLPLYGKILGWFFLNLVVVAVVVLLLFNAQFRFNLDWFFTAGGARERLEAVRDLIVDELSGAAPEEWPAVIERYSTAYHVRFAVFDDDAALLVGGSMELPAPVRERIAAWESSGRGRRSGGDREEQRRGGPRQPLRALMRTDAPVGYWLLASARLDNPRFGESLRVVLVARSNSIAGGGLIFNPRPWLGVALGVVLFSLLFWLPLVGGITGTVARMVQATRQMAQGRFEVRMNLRRRDELGSLAESIDQMAVRLDGLVNGQRRFLGDIAHELCAPLARLQMALGILEQRASPAEAGYVRSAAEKAGQIADLVGELLSFSKASFGASSVRLQPVRLLELAHAAARREQTEGVELQWKIPEELCVSADPDLLLRAIANLLRNALRHAAAAGPISLQAGREGAEVLLLISDRGPGVAEEELPKIFDAFYRVDPSRTRETGGLGLGLAIVKSCVEACGGHVLARNRVPHGLEVEIRLSEAPELAPSSALAAANGIPHAGAAL